MLRGSRPERQNPPTLVGGADASRPANGLQKCMPPDRCAIENTIGEQWNAALAASEPCSLRITNAPVGRNRFIAPFGLAARYAFKYSGKRLRGAAQ
jgi:hypothetical protein